MPVPEFFMWTGFGALVLALLAILVKDLLIWRDRRRRDLHHE